jgi:predicted chitinase
MTDTNKIKAWAFPFKSAGDASKEITDPQLYYKALATAKSGFYPMGDNGLWHGGVHFDSGTAAALNQSSVRCIADGEVIAYRIDNQYPESEYRSAPPLIKRAPFSTGFVLVKHRLELPPATPAETAEALTFYSLYMHLLDWKGYQAPGAPLPPPFLAETNYLVSDQATDPTMGLRVRKLASGGSTEVLAILPKGCKVTLGPAGIGDPRWKQLASIVEGAAVPPLPSGVIGWVYAPELTGDTVAGDGTDTEPTLTLSHQGLNVRKEGKLSGTIIGVLPQGAKVKLGAKSTVDSNYYKLLEVLDYKGVPALPNGADGKPLGYVYLSKLKAIAGEPKAKDVVYSLPTPHRIKAGELIGHLGQYQNHDDSAPTALLHLEVFSCEDVPAFIAKSRARASSLPVEQKTLLRIHKRASKLIPHRADISTTNPPKITDEGVKVGVDLIIPIGVLDSLPADHKIKVSETVPGSATPRITQWWRVDNLLADEAGNPIGGWLAEQDLLTTRHSPWEWEGFDFISETVCAADQFACHLDAQRLVSEVGLADYQAQINTADNGPVKTRLYDIIDGADGSTRDDKLTTTEIRAALSKPWHAQSISRLITHYESEWFGKADKWDELDKLMDHTLADPNPSWVSEKQRIQKLSYWAEVAGKHGITGDGKSWHLHSMGLVGQFISCHQALISFDQMKRMFPDSTEAKREEVRDLFNRYANRFEINTPARISQFFAQIKAEVGHALVGNEESLWYSVQALKDKFKRYFDTYPAEAETLGYKRISLQQYNNLAPAARVPYTVRGQYAYSQLPQPDEIAKRVYCCNTSSGGFALTQGGCGEGLMYKGKGFIQLTWKTNYEQVEKLLKETVPEEPIDIVANPDQLIETKFGLLSAMGFWGWKKLNNLVQGTTDSTNAITAVVNLNTDSYEKRRDNFTAIYQVLQ